ncbi:MAG: cupredoxin domain-containing protein [Actinomycetota bacterium]|nr:cupredoxin domain-containing protein [Actinomycetota bacterium]
MRSGAAQAGTSTSGSGAEAPAGPGVGLAAGKVRSTLSTLRHGGAVLAAVGAGAVLLAACSSTPSAQPNVAKLTGNAPWMVTQPKAPAGSGGSSADIKLQINDVNTPEGSEPAYVGSGGVGAQVLFTVKVGQAVKVTIVNHDAMPHTFTAPDINVNASVNPGSSTTFTFTPSAAGTFSWYCSVPCGDWVMSHTGYMKGSVTVTA